MKLKMTLLLLLVGLLSVSACKNENTSETPKADPFTLSTSIHQTETAYQVQYTVVKTNDVKIDLIRYVTNEGEKSVANPVSPWTLSVNVDKAKSVYLVASGSITSGKIFVMATGSGDEGGHHYSFTDSLSQSK